MATEPSAPGPQAHGHLLVDAYLDHLRVERRLAPHTLESYGRDLVRLARYAAGRARPLQDLTRSDLEAFTRELMADGLAARSVARAVACIRGFYRYLAVESAHRGEPRR